MSRTIYPVILSGGSGTRLWPLSRDHFPKQLLALVGPESLLVATARRVHGAGFAPPMIVCNQDHRFLVREQLEAVGITPDAIVIEPVARNTAPAIAAAAALLAKQDPSALMLVLPSDHIVRDLDAFARAVATAADAAATGCLVTFGITPTAPETGYGYIRRGAALGKPEGAFRIERFVEKPDLATAAGYLADGAWSWNSGMFVFPAKLLLDELASFEPAMVTGVTQAVEKAGRDDNVISLDADAFGGVPSKSIDYALMERTKHSAIVPADLGWSDVGSWSALWDIADRDKAGNVAIGDVMAEDTEGSYLRSHGPLLATLGVKDLVVVATGDVVMVAAKDRAQDVKTFIARLRESGRTEGTSHIVVNRPWGTYQTVDSGAQYQVKRITVKPGCKLSLQKHAKRAEHWVVVNGTARVTRDDDILTLRANMSTYIPLGAVHRLENAGPDPLELIEVQSGSYLGEDDIVRLSDDYGRK
jgi:mannose-1-phosphate guanylyltransferase/mannose-1-phosphate guanylyltransferase/mannose-6-phosphate isomerase